MTGGCDDAAGVGGCLSGGVDDHEIEIGHGCCRDVAGEIDGRRERRAGRRDGARHAGTEAEGQARRQAGSRDGAKHACTEAEGQARRQAGSRDGARHTDHTQAALGTQARRAGSRSDGARHTDHSVCHTQAALGTQARRAGSRDDGNPSAPIEAPTNATTAIVTTWLAVVRS